MSYVHHTVLLVDSDPDQAHFTRLALQRVGVITPVQHAHDGEEAIAYLSGAGDFGDRELHPLPMLMLLDLKLPHISGVGLLSWLREQQALRRLPVVVLTVPVPAADLNRAYELGCNSFLFKPNSFNALLVLMQGVAQYWLGFNVPPGVGAAAAEAGGQYGPAA
ncbi:response regulator [Geomonas terrae]|uniref:Response regulator n=1 Tax=Geomonas terrae TaxID=2562681 RepID=A0A4S1CG47_9BACT|nr:response regulator [Geomonas terrae]TGU72507.1 response regulator [Geomonas terrae]